MIEPRILCVPESSASLGREAVDLYRQATGNVLDAEQAFVLERAMGLRPDGKWAAFEAAVNGPRQNGKNEIAIARQLAGMFLIKTKLLIHSAHEFKTSTEHQRRLEEIIQDAPDLHKRVKPRGYKHSHGEESIELRTGQRIRFMTRTKGGGKGHTGDEVYLDEAQILPAAMVGALMPTLSARSIHGNPQLWYFFTAVDQFLQEHGIVAARLRERALAGDDASLAYFEWSAHVGDPREDDPERLTVAMLSDRRRWAEANTALGVRISEEYIANELRSMGAREFAVERLGVGSYPVTDGSSATVIEGEKWDALADTRSRLEDPVCFGVAVTHDRAWSTVAAAGKNAGGAPHVEVVARRRGTAWLPDWVAERVTKHQVAAVVCNGVGAAATLAHRFEDAGVELELLSAGEYAAACGLLFDLVEDGALRHTGDDDLDAAAKAAGKRSLGGRFAWSGQGAAADVSPLEAATLALWGAETGETETGPMVAFG